jgi:hypothetical protein
MDATTFDDLIKRLAATRLTRLTALRGLAMGALAALTGVGLTAEEASAKKNHEKKVKVCKCPDSNSANCRTDKVKKSQAKKQARKACNYKGACRSGVTSCAGAAAGPQCTNNNDCSGGLVCISQRCQACTADFQCPGNLVCIGGTCQNRPSNAECTTNADCGQFEACLGAMCGPCTHYTQCGAGEACIADRCLGPTSIACEDPPGSGQPEDFICARISHLLTCQPIPPPDGDHYCQLEIECPPAVDAECNTDIGEFCVLSECVRTCSDTNPCKPPDQIDTHLHACIGGLCIRID